MDVETHPSQRRATSPCVNDSPRSTAKCPIAQVARELGLSETTLGNWVRAYRESHATDEPPLELSERARLRELERQNRELEMENAFLKKAAAYFAREPR
jgi:transposase